MLQLLADDQDAEARRNEEVGPMMGARSRSAKYQIDQTMISEPVIMSRPIAFWTGVFFDPVMPTSAPKTWPTQ